MKVTAAQSLGEVARLEAERRKQVAAGQIYTNEDLEPVDPSVPSVVQSPVETATAAGGKAPDTPAPAAAPATNGDVEPVVKGREKRDEQYWRELARDLRQRLAKTTADIAASEARISEIDGSPQTPALAREREVISETLAALQRSVRHRNDELARFVAKARSAKAPDEWIR